jgi:hypothetical protein
VQLAISEALVWSLQELVQRLQRSLAAAAEAGDGGGAVAAADVPVRIRLLAVDTLRTQISFQGDPFSRPRCRSWWGMGGLGTQALGGGVHLGSRLLSASATAHGPLMVPLALLLAPCCLPALPPVTRWAPAHPLL